MRRAIAGVLLSGFVVTSACGQAATDGVSHAIPSPLLSIDQNRATVIDRIVADWGSALDQSNAGISSAQLRAMLGGLRADHLLAASLAGSLSGLRDVLATAATSVAPVKNELGFAKALGDANQDLSYTPVSPCRLFDTRTSQGGLGTPTLSVRRTYGAVTPVASQGGPGGCGAGAGAVVALIQLGTLTPSGSGILQGGPQGAASFPNALILYQPGDQYGATVAMPLNAVNGQFDLLELFAAADLYADLLGYFKPPTGFVASVTGGTGITVTGTTTATLSLPTAYQLPQACTGGQVAKSNGAGVWNCAADNNSGGTVTSVATGTGLTGGPVTTTGTVSVAAGGIGTAELANASVTNAKLAAGVASANLASCWEGQYLRRSASATWTCGNTPEVTTLPDGTGNVGSHIGIANGTDDRPVISYYDGTNGNLKVLKCSNANCNVFQITTVDNSANDVGQYSSVAAGADTFPVIAYYDLTTGDLKVAKCANAACTGAPSSITTVDSSPNNVGQYTSLKVGGDTLPVISYYDATAGALKVAKCVNVSCTGISTINAVDPAAGQYSSLAIGTDTFPVISYYDVANGDLKVAHCIDVACASPATITTVDSTGDVGRYTSIAIGLDTFPVISYYDVTNGDLKVAKCANTACTGAAAITTVVSVNDTGQYTSLAVGTDGNPIVSFYDATAGDLRAVKCTNASCSAPATISSLHSAGDLGQYSALVIPGDHFPLVAYYDAANQDLRVLKCTNTACSFP